MAICSKPLDIHILRDGDNDLNPAYALTLSLGLSVDAGGVIDGFIFK